MNDDFHKPWFTPDLKKMSLEKNKLHKKYILNPTPLNLKECKTYKNKCVYILHLTKKRN